MITAEIKINGCLIGYIHLINKINVPTKTDMANSIYDRCQYTGTFFEIESGKSIPLNIRHYRSEGAIKLISLATQQIIKSLNKKDKQEI